MDVEGDIVDRADFVFGTSRTSDAGECGLALREDFGQVADFEQGHAGDGISREC